MRQFLQFLLIVICSCGYTSHAIGRIAEKGRLTQTLDFALTMPSSLEAGSALAQAIEEKIAKYQSQPDVGSTLLELAILYHANDYEVQARKIYDWLILNSTNAEEKGRLNYLAAHLVKEKGNSEAAMKYLEASVSAYQSYSLAFALLGDSKYKVGDLDEAEDYFQKALAVERGLSVARVGLARVYERRNDLRKAIEELEELLQDEVKNNTAQAMLSQLYARIGDESLAYKISESIAYSSNPPEVDPWLSPVREAIYDVQRLEFLFLDYFMVSKYETALSYLGRIEALDPGESRWSKYRGIAYMESGNYDWAVERFRRSLGDGGDPGELYPLLVKALGFQGLKSEAEEVASDAVEDHGANAKLCLEWARILVEQDRIEEALAILEKGLKRNPYNIDSHLLRGRIALKLGRTETAKDSLDMVRQLSPMDAKVMVWAALLYMEAGMYAEALPFSQQAFDAYPYNEDAIELLSDASYELGMVSIKEGNFKEAMKRFNEAIKVNARHEGALSIRARLLIEQQRFEEAEVALLALFEVTVADPRMLLIYGDILTRNNKSKEAKVAWEQALILVNKHQVPEELKRLLIMRLQQ